MRGEERRDEKDDRRGETRRMREEMDKSKNERDICVWGVRYNC